jgi:hypothetical protein
VEIQRWLEEQGRLICWCGRECDGRRQGTTPKPTASSQQPADRAGLLLYRPSDRSSELQYLSNLSVERRKFSEVYFPLFHILVNLVQAKYSGEGQRKKFRRLSAIVPLTLPSVFPLTQRLNDSTTSGVVHRHLAPHHLLSVHLVKQLLRIILVEQIDIRKSPLLPRIFIYREADTGNLALVNISGNFVLEDCFVDRIGEVADEEGGLGAWTASVAGWLAGVSVRGG